MFNVKVLKNATDDQYATLVCPGCGTKGILDKDQYQGRVSVLCDCGWHETHNFEVAQESEE